MVMQTLAGIPGLQQGSNVSHTLETVWNKNVTTELELIESPAIRQKTVESIGLSVLYPDIGSKIRLEQPPLWMKLGISLKKLFPGHDPQSSEEKILADRNLRLKENAMNRFQHSLKIAVTDDGNVITIYFRHQDRLIATAALRILLKAYLKSRCDIHAPEDAKPYEIQLRQSGETLRSIENRIEELGQNGDVSLLMEKKKSLIRQRDAMSASIQETQQSLQAVESKLESKRDLLKNAKSHVASNALPADPAVLLKMRETLADLETTRTMLLGKPGLLDQDLRDIEGKIASLKAFLKRNESPRSGSAEPSGGKAGDDEDKELIKLSNEAVNLRKRLDSKQRDYDFIVAQLESSTALEKRLNGLMAEKDAASQNLAEYSKRLQEINAINEVRRQAEKNIKIIQAPRTAHLDTALSGIIILLSIPLGLLMALLIDRVSSQS